MKEGGDKSKFKKGHIEIQRKQVQIVVYMHDRAITVLHDQWMCLGIQRHTHITLCNLVTI